MHYAARSALFRLISRVTSHNVRYADIVIPIGRPDTTSIETLLEVEKCPYNVVALADVPPVPLQRPTI
jgi:hypothetical protein